MWLFGPKYSLSLDTLCLNLTLLSLSTFKEEEKNFEDSERFTGILNKCQEFLKGQENEREKFIIDIRVHTKEILELIGYSLHGCSIEEYEEKRN